MRLKDLPATYVVFVMFKWFAQLYGILPFSCTGRQFKRSRVRDWYGRAVAVLLTIVYGWGIQKLLSDVDFPVLATSFYLVGAQLTLNYIITIIMFLQVLSDPSVLLLALNRLLESTETLLQLTYSTITSNSSAAMVGRRLLVKLIVVDCVMCLAWYGAFCFWIGGISNLQLALAWWLNTVAVMQLTVMTNLLTGALLWISFLYRLINDRVRLIVVSMLQMDESASFWYSATKEKQLILNHIRCQLHALQTHHNTLSETIVGFTKFYDVPLALTILFEFIIVISEVSQHQVRFRFSYFMQMAVPWVQTTYNKPTKRSVRIGSSFESHVVRLPN
ncbi:uncharacterized protein LOC118459788 [Anopheles albimanus]|uniref:uncharacterized protein LOC118459788 n=1 Tax=Anopheles albimanus TaxID=7167 RepID=UPI00163DEBB7|nr:uncharacterized protein LOC118459788 [Anopheles albimanus]